MKSYSLLLFSLLFSVACNKKYEQTTITKPVPVNPVMLDTAVVPVLATFNPYNDTFYGTLRHTIMYPIAYKDTFITMYVMHTTVDHIRFSKMVTDQNPLGIHYSDTMVINETGFYQTWINSSYTLKKDSLFYYVTFEHCPDYDIWYYTGKLISKPHMTK